MERPTKENIQGLINYIRGLDIEHLKTVKNEQHDLILYTFESQRAEPNDEAKQILMDDAYLSWLLFMRFDMDKSLGQNIDYKTFLNNISTLKKIWCAAKAKANFEKTGQRVYEVTVEDINKELPGILFRSCENAPDQPIVLSSMVIAMDYENVVQTLARKDL